MGYSTDSRGRLCCDRCDSSEHKARRRPCPVRYCPAAIICSVCWADPEIRAEWAAYHVKAGCREALARYHAEETAKAAIIAEGGYVRSAALSVDAGLVHVLFRGASGYIGRYIPSHVYGSSACQGVMRPEDYEAATGCKLAEAPAEFSYAAKAQP